MYKKFSNLLIALLASLIFLVGAGVTVIDLCCTSCINTLVSINKDKGMCEDMRMSLDSDSCCGKESHHSQEKQGDCCTIERISVDLDHSIFKPIISSPFVWCADLMSNLTQTIEPNVDNLGFENDRYRPPIPIPPREYLSLIRILII